MTTMIVGCAPDRPGTGALHLAALLARSAGDDPQVFLGSRATKIVRHSPVPVRVLPRARTERLAEEAARA